MGETFHRLFGIDFIWTFLYVIFCFITWLWHELILEELQKKGATIKTSRYARWASFLALIWPVIIVYAIIDSPMESVSLIGFRDTRNILATGMMLGAVSMIISAVVIYCHIWKPRIKMLGAPILLGLLSIVTAWFINSPDSGASQSTHTFLGEIFAALFAWGWVISSFTWWQLLKIHGTPKA